MVSSESAKNAVHQASTDLKIDHLTDAIKVLGEGQTALGVAIRTSFQELHDCIDNANADAKSGIKELKDDLKEELKTLSGRLDTRDNLLEHKIEICRESKRP